MVGIGAVDRNFTNIQQTIPTSGSSGSYLSVAGNYASVFAMRSALQTFDPFTYTNAVLDIMSMNDIVFALRSVQDANTIASYMPNQTARVA